MTPQKTMREALADPILLGNALPGESWRLWRILLIAAMGEPLVDDEPELFHAVTGRESGPQERVDELWCIVGRRAGKTRGAATLAAYLATLCDWSEYLAPGERGALPVLAAAQYQAGKAFEHIEAILTHSPGLSSMMDGTPTADTIRLTNMVDIIITPANFRTVRSITAIGAVADEVAFWSIEGTKNPDREILNALRPALATTHAPLIVISSPYARRGELYRTFKSDYGLDGDPAILVAKGQSRTFNPTLSKSVVDKAYQRDASAARAEYGGEFRTDVETLLTREIVEDAVDVGVTVRGRQSGVRYFAFVDPSGGSSDSMTLGIAHREGDRAVIDATAEKKPPFSPEAVTAEFVTLIKSYGIQTVTGDRYGAEWCRGAFRRQGVEYRPSEANRSELYLNLVPALNSGRVALLDDDRVVEQLIGLERRTSRVGRDSVDHAPGAHDDLANVIAGAVWLALAVNDTPTVVIGTYTTVPPKNPNPLSGTYSYA